MFASPDGKPRSTEKSKKLENRGWKFWTMKKTFHTKFSLLRCQERTRKFDILNFVNFYIINFYY